jgi:hypothetical protein
MATEIPAKDQPKEFAQVVAEELAVLRPASGESTALLSALCISGGGIRSATFALGALQGLADEGVLQEFDYLSTVSGGGYIGGWLTSWKHRAGGLGEVLPKLRTDAPPAGKDELDPIGYLREYNSYLSPKLGFFSADAWTLAATVLRNMTLNWLVLIPLLLFALMAPRLILALGFIRHLSFGGTMPPALAAPVGIIAGLFFAMSIFNTMRYLPGVGAKDHTEADFLKYCLTPLILAAMGFMTYDSWFDPYTRGPDSPTYVQMLPWIAGSCAAGWIGYLVFWLVAGRHKMAFGSLTLAIILTGVSTATGAWLLVTKAYLYGTWGSYITIGPPLLLLSFMVAGGLFVGLTSRTLEDEDREWLARGAAWMLMFVIGWAAVCCLVLVVPAWIFAIKSTLAKSSLAAAGGIAGWISSIAGFKSDAATRDRTTSDQTDAPNKILNMDLAAKLAAPVFVAALLAGLSILTNWILSGLGLAQEDWTDHEGLLESTHALTIAGGALVFLILGWIAARYININKFSLHAMYRSRLIRAYLGASNNRSDVNKFIGFTKSDNIFMGDLKAESRPFHVVNMTLNLVAGKRLAWQQRKAESFTSSALHTGSARLEYRPSKSYGGPQGISLGTAITISGAAASPNMGYHSAGVIGFIMTLFNARLGAWFGNPGEAGNRTWRKDGPSSAVASLVKEALGLTDDTSAYVYLSDGGHFENLGLYEMVMRGCQRIVVLDSGCDPKFIYEDLGNALRKIRIDMGIEIDFKDALVQPLRDRRKRCAMATIGYKDAGRGPDDGVLVYIKPMMTGNEPPDVSTYQASHQDFPHQSTADQWYDESQTESYRMLGWHTIDEVCEGRDKKGGLSGMFDHIRDFYIPRK